MAEKRDRNLSKIGGMYYFRIRWNGEDLKRSLGVTNKAAARDLRDEYLKNLAMYGQLDPPEPEGAGITFGEYAKKWADIYRPGKQRDKKKNRVSASTWRDYKSIMNHHVLPIFKDRPISDIAYSEIMKFYNELDVSAKRANNIMVPMKSVFEMAYKDGIIADNVMKKIDRADIEQPDIRPFSYAQIYQVLDAIDPWYRPYVQVAFFSGMRAGELNALKWSDYSPDQGKLHIRRAYVYGADGPPKTKKSKRDIDCLAEVVEALDQQQEQTGGREFIFLDKKGRRMKPDHFREVVWKPALKKAGVTYRPPIQTRHSFATMMISEGVDLGRVQQMLGHANLQMIYHHYHAWRPENYESVAGMSFSDLGRQQKAAAEPAEQNKGADPQQSVEGMGEGSRCTNVVPFDLLRARRKLAKVKLAENTDE